MQVGGTFRIDLRGSIFSQVTSTVFYLRTSPIDAGPFNIDPRQLVSDFRVLYLPAILSVISRTWIGVSMNLYEYHLRGQPYEQDHVPMNLITGGFEDESLPPQVASKMYLVGINLTSDYRNRRFVLLPGVPRGSVNAGVIVDGVLNGRMQVALRALTAPHDSIADALKRFRITPVIPLKRQPAGQPIHQPVSTDIIQGLSRASDRLGRVIRRTIGRGV